MTQVINSFAARAGARERQILKQTSPRADRYGIKSVVRFMIMGGQVGVKMKDGTIKEMACKNLVAEGAHVLSSAIYSFKRSAELKRRPFITFAQWTSAVDAGRKALARDKEAGTHHPLVRQMWIKQGECDG